MIKKSIFINLIWQIKIILNSQEINNGHVQINSFNIIRYIDLLFIKQHWSRTMIGTIVHIKCANIQNNGRRFISNKSSNVLELFSK